MCCSRIAVPLCAAAALAWSVTLPPPPSLQKPGEFIEEPFVEEKFFGQQSAFLDKANVSYRTHADLLKRLDEYLKSQEAFVANITAEDKKYGFHRKKLVYHQAKLYQYLQQIDVHKGHWEFLDSAPEMIKNQTPIENQLKAFHRNRIAFIRDQVAFHRHQRPLHEHMMATHQQRIGDTPLYESIPDRVQMEYHNRQNQFHMMQSDENERLVDGHRDHLAILQNDTVDNGNISDFYKKQVALYDRYKAYHKDQIAYLQTKNLFHMNRAAIHGKLYGLNETNSTSQ